MSQEQDQKANQPPQKKDTPATDKSEGSASEFSDRSPGWTEKELEMAPSPAPTEPTTEEANKPSEEPEFSDRSPGWTEKGIPPKDSQKG